MARIRPHRRAARGPAGHPWPGGYILLPVVLAITLVAAIALMLSQEGAIEAGDATRELEAEQARYVAEAGLNHALWRMGQAGCGPYTDISGQAFGGGSYSATITPNNAGGTTTTCTVAVSDDAWIKSDTPTQNYGGDAQLATYFNFLPSTTQRALYRFDLQGAGIPASAVVVSAVAKVFVVDSNAVADLTVHRVNADWTEATVTWDSINASYDASPVASIPKGAPAGQYVSVNLTPLARGWVSGGTANQGVMLQTTWIDDLTQLTSKEYGNTAQRPRPSWRSPATVAGPGPCWRTSSAPVPPPPARAATTSAPISRPIPRCGSV